MNNKYIHRSNMNELSALFLSVLMSIFVFLFAQLIMKSALYGMAFLIPVVILFVFRSNQFLWNLLTALSTVSTYLFLSFVFPGSMPLPYGFMLYCSVSLVLTAVIAGTKLLSSREQHKTDERQKLRDQLIAEINTKLLTAATAEELYISTLQHLHIVTQKSAVFYTSDEHGIQRTASFPAGLIIYEKEASFALEAFVLGQPVGVGTSHERDTSFLFLPVKVSEQSVGVVGILFSGEALPSSSLIEILQMILVRVGVALEKHRLFRAQRATQLDKELEKVRSDFLRSVSHDFRTPLTAILGACSVLSENQFSIEKSDQQELISGIEEEAAWLLRMLENLLSITRVGAERFILHKNPEPLEEILEQTNYRVRKRFADYHLHIDQPQELVMVPVDPMLIIQVLINLIENSVKHSTDRKELVLRVEKQSGQLVFSLRDFGSGLSAQAQETLFLDSHDKISDANGGMGLGLIICKSIIEAHGGEISGGNHPDGIGAVFTFRLPLEEINEE